MESPEHERAAIERYMAWQAPDESMVHLEKVTSERVMGRDRDVWDVHTDKEPPRPSGSGYEFEYAVRVVSRPRPGLGVRDGERAPCVVLDSGTRLRYLRGRPSFRISPKRSTDRAGFSGVPCARFGLP